MYSTLVLETLFYAGIYCKNLKRPGILKTSVHRLYPYLLQRRSDIFLQSRLHLKKRDYSGVTPWVLNKLTQEAVLAYHSSDLKENLAVKMANKILDCLRNDTVNSTKKVEMPLAV